MPYRRKYTRRRLKRKRSRSFGRRSRYKRRKRNSYNFSLIRGPSFMPDRLHTTHTLSQTFTFVGDGITGGKDYLLQCNDLHNPHTTQAPLGYTQMGALYERYQVNGCWVKITMQNTTPYAGLFTIAPNLDATIPGITATDMAAFPRAKQVLFSPGGQTGDMKTLSGYQTSKAMFANELVQSASYSAPYGSSPSKHWYYHVKIEFRAIPGVSELVHFQLKMKFRTSWYRVQQIDQAP